MKTSDRILIYSALLIAAIIAVIIASSRFINVRFASGNPSYAISSAGKIVTNEYPLEGFTGVSVSGGWEVEVNAGKGNRYRVSVVLPESDSSNIDVSILGGVLNIKYKNPLFFGWKSPHKIMVILPELAYIDSSGYSKFSFSGFDSENLDITSSGSFELTGSTSTVRRLKVNSSGSSRINLGGCRTKDADIHTSGSSFISLCMEGGDLAVDTSGSSTVNYSGVAGRKEIHQTGSGSVTQIE
jgi:hypothetical protein